MTVTQTVVRIASSRPKALHFNAVFLGNILYEDAGIYVRSCFINAAAPIECVAEREILPSATSR
jgi:hypothetical protein